MTYRSIFKVFIVLSLSLVFGISISAQDCSATTDDQLVDAIMAKMKGKYASQMTHINVRSKDRVVTVEGWATTKKIKGEVEKIAKKINCVKSVKNLLTIGVGGGCGPGTKPCGTICIPTEEICNIGKDKKAP